MDYIVAAANLTAQLYGMEGTRDRASIKQISDEVTVTSFTPKSSVKIHLTDKEMNEDKDCDDAGE